MIYNTTSNNNTMSYINPQPLALKYFRINHGVQRVLLNLKSSYMSYSSLSASLEYLRYVPTAIRHISTLTAREKTLVVRI